MEVQVDFFQALCKMLCRQQRTYPTMADSIVLTSGAGDWEVGALTEVIPAGIIEVPFAIGFIGLGLVSATQTVYEIELFKGEIGAEVEIGQTRAFRQMQQSGSAPSPCQTEILPAGTRISARCATGGIGAETIGIAVFYKQYEGIAVT